MTKVDYDKVPISEATKKGMTLTIDDLAAIGRLLSLQDLVYDEQFEKMFSLLGKINRRLDRIEKTQRDHETRIKNMEDAIKQIPGLKIA
jgi:hypothetical protein